MQYEKSKDIFNNITQGKLNRTNAVKIMKPLNLNSNAVKLILDTALLKYKKSIKYTGQVKDKGFIRNNKLERDIGLIDYLRLAINNRANFYFNKVINSPTYIIFLGGLKSAILLLILLLKVFDIEKLFIVSINKILTYLSNQI